MNGQRQAVGLTARALKRGERRSTLRKGISHRIQELDPKTRCVTINQSGCIVEIEHNQVVELQCYRYGPDGRADRESSDSGARETLREHRSAEFAT